MASLKFDPDFWNVVQERLQPRPQQAPLPALVPVESSSFDESPEGGLDSGDAAGSTTAAKAKEVEVEWLEASQIRFSQSTICEAFSRPPAKAVADAAPEQKSYARVAAAAPRSSKYTVLDAVRDLNEGRSKIEDFPPIRVVEQDGLLFSLDNRRLYVFKLFGSTGLRVPVRRVPADKELFQKLTCTGTGDARGRTVQVLTEEEAREVGRVLQLEQHVLKWSVPDIMNDYLLVRKVRPIPDKFPNIRSYLSAFRWPLVEECRASLKSSLGQLSASTPMQIDIHKVERLDGYVAGADDYDEEDEWEEGGYDMGRQDVFGSDWCEEEDVYGSYLFGGARRERKPVKVHSDTGRFGAVVFEVDRQKLARDRSASGGGGGSWFEGVKLKPTDVVLLSTVAPTEPNDLLRAGVLYLLGVLLPDRNVTEGISLPGQDGGQEGGGGGGDGSSSYFKAKIFLPKESPELKGLEEALVRKKSDKGDGAEGGGTWYVTLLDTFATPQRIWDALHGYLGQEEWSEMEGSERDRMMKLMLEEVLCSEKGAGRRGGKMRITEEAREKILSTLPPAITIAPDVVPELLQAVGDFCHARGLNHPQQAAILACLRGFLSSAASSPFVSSAFPSYSSSSSSQFSSFSSPLDNYSSVSRKLLQLVQGPPGTGKTHTISVLLSIVLSLGVRTLVCAPTNVAAAEVGRRMLRLALFSDPSSQFAGYCHGQQQQYNGWGGRGDVPMAFVRGGKLRVGDIALVANEDRLEIDPELGMILVGSERKGGGGKSTFSGRIGRLVGALSLLTGWRPSFSSLLSFLDISWEALNQEFQTELEAEEERRKKEAVFAGDVGRGGIDKKGPKKAAPLPTLVAYLQKRIDFLTQPAMEAAVNLAEDLPSALLPENQRLLLLQAFDLMAALRQLVRVAGLTPAVLKTWLEGTGGLAGEEGGVEEVVETAFVLLGLGVSAAGGLDGDSAMSTVPNAYSIPRLSGAPTFATVAAVCIENAKLVLSTVSSSARPLLRFSTPFPLLLLDEAAQLVEAESVVALQTKGLRYAVLVGDPKQLPATVLSKVAVEGHYNRSLFERLQGNGWEVHMLSVQYRMHPEISRFPSHCFYEGRIEDGANVCRPSHSPQHLEPLFGPYMFMHVKGKEERDVGAVEGGSRSIANSVEAVVVLALLKRLSDACKGAEAGSRTGSSPMKVGLISPYALQVEYLKRALESQSWPHLVVEVKSVDGFQGRECDVIIVTTVRSNMNGSIGFEWVVAVRVRVVPLHAGPTSPPFPPLPFPPPSCFPPSPLPPSVPPPRLNVAITRARYCMWVVGDRETLQRGDTTWERLLVDAQQRGCLVEAHSDAKLRRVVERRQMELGEVEQLLLPNSGLWDSLIWEATFSLEFQRSMRELRSLDVINAVRRLMGGHRPQRCTRPRHELKDPRYYDIIHVQAVGRYQLIWTVDVSRTTYKQIIRVWDVVEEQNVLKWLRRLEGGLGTYSDESLDRCARCDDRLARRVQPLQFPKDPGFTWHRAKASPRDVAAAPDTESALERAPVDESVLLMKFYQLSLGSVRQLLTAAQGELPFEVNEQEALIVHYPGSLFVLGRSGTGKTTIITHRLLRLERVFLRAMGERGRLGPAVGIGMGSGRGGEVGGEGGRGKAVGDEKKGGKGGEGGEGRSVGTLRQVIVTLSPRLCAAIRHHVHKVRRTMLEADSDLPASTAPPSTAQGGKNHQQQQQGEAGEVEELLLSEEAEEKLMGDLPESLDEVQPDAYPLVLTFKKLLSMVNATLARPFQQDGGLKAGGWHGKGTTGGGGWRRGGEDYRGGGGGGTGGDGSDDDGSEYFSEDEDDEEEEEEEDEEKDGFGAAYHQSHWHRDRPQGTSGARSSSAAGVSPGSGSGSGSGGAGVLSLPEEVDYDRFESLYWPHFNTTVTRKLDASLVYKEFFSHIKGSLHALRSPRGRLSKEDYVALAQTRTSSFDEAQREVIYGLYLQYEREKRQRGDHDLCDYVYHVYRELAKGATKICTPAALAAAAASAGTAAASRATTTRSMTSRGSGGDDKVRSGPPFQYVYVDEVQDLTQAQIAILRFLCANTSDGFVFAGDTAQTIARGVDFRFQDIRRLFYELFLGRKVDVVGDVGNEGVEGGGDGVGGAGGAGEGENGPEEGRGREKQGRWAGAAAARGKQKLSGKGRRMLEEVGGGATAETALTVSAAQGSERERGEQNKGETGTKAGGGGAQERSSCTEMPDLFFLSQNFRAHNGIVRLADSVVRVLLHFFPHAVDRLAPEFSLIDGEAPVFLDAKASDDVVTQLFGKKGAIGGGGCEFGAEQVILVRDAESRTELVKRIGSKGLVLSVHECKGLEFQDLTPLPPIPSATLQDALVYNFFSGSPMASSWRLLYHYMREHSLIPSAEDGSSRWQCPSFDPKRHNLMCSELKQLYVVLTRARQRLWIYEEDEGARRPAMDLWGAMGVVAVKALTPDLLTSMHTESSPEGWHKRGTELFNAAQFEAAVLSFERAGDEHSAAVARAALLQQTAKRLQGTDPKKASKTFQEAAEAFLKVEKPRDAARCFISAGKMKQAGDVYRDRCHPPMWVKAGECYELASLPKEAAKCFAQAWEVERALLVCSQNRLYNLGVTLLQVWQGQVGEGMGAAKGQQQQLGVEEEEKWRQRDRLVTKKNAEFLQQAAMYYYRKKMKGEMMRFVLQFPSLAKKRQFLERRDFFDDLLQIEVSEGNFQRAAEMMLKKGDMVGAARMFLGQKEWGRAFECAMGAGRVASMWASGNKGWPLNAPERKLEKQEKQDKQAQKVEKGKEEEKKAKAKAGKGPQGREGKEEVLRKEIEKWWQLLTRCRSSELLGMVGEVGKNALKNVSASVSDQGAGKGEVVAEEGKEREGEEGEEGELGVRSLAAEVLVSWQGLQLSIQRAKASLTHHPSSSLSRSTAAPSAPLLPTPAKPVANLASRASPAAAAPAVPLRPGWQKEGATLGTPQQLQQQEQGQKEKQEELAFEADLREVKLWWGRWSERVAAMVSALQRLQRRRELPSDAPWLEATFHLLSVSSPASASSSSHSASHALASSSAQSFLVGLSSAYWLNTVRPAVNHLPNQGTRGEVAREAAARAGAIYWARQASEMVQECAGVMQQALGSLEKGTASRREPVWGTSAGVAGSVPHQGGVVRDRAWLEKEKGEAEDRKRAKELHVQLELLVEVYSLLQFAGKSRKQQQDGEQGNEVQGAGGSAEEGGIAQLAGEVELWKEQQKATLQLLSLLFPVTSPLPRSLAFVVARWREDERSRVMMQQWARDCVQKCVVEGNKELHRELEEEAQRNQMVPPRLQQQQQQQQEKRAPLVPLGLMTQLMQVLPYLGPWWIRRECQGLKEVVPEWRQDVCARMMKAAQWEQQAQSFTLQHDFLLPGTVALNSWDGALYPMYNWCRWDQKDGFVSLPVFLNLVEKALVHMCAAITNLENLSIPTSLAALHLEGQHHSSLCTHMLLRNFNRAPSTLGLLHSKILPQLLHIIIQLAVSKPDKLQWWMDANNMPSSDRGSVFLRLLVLLMVSVSNVGPSYRQPFFNYLLGHLSTVFSYTTWPPNPFVPMLPHELQQDLKSMFGRESPPITPNELYGTLCRHMFAMRDPWVLLRRRGSFIIPDYVWKAELLHVNVEFIDSGASNDGQQSPVFSLENLTGFRGLRLLGGESDGIKGGAAGAAGGAGVGADAKEEAAVGDSSPEVPGRGEEGGVDGDGKIGKEEEAGAGGGGGGGDGEGGERESAETKGGQDVGAMSEGAKEVEQELTNAQLQSDTREEVDGVKIAQWITQQLRSCLHEARERLQQELSPLQQCSREAHRGLTAMLQPVSPSERAFYVQEYEEHACPVKVEADAFLALIHEGVRQLKQLLQQEGSGTGQGQQQRKGQGRGWSEEEAEKNEELLEEALDAAESLKAANKVVHHSHPGHASASVEWLHNEAIAPLANLLSQHKSLEQPLKRLSTENQGAGVQAGSGKGGSAAGKQGGSSGVQESGGGKGKGKKGGGRSGGKDGGGGGKGGKKQRGGKSKR
ncbi:unnamed protein product [Closterium sp. NIES-64]|nr:unnamed protein product [Closterium sp. NIES-64]